MSFRTVNEPHSVICQQGRSMLRPYILANTKIAFTSDRDGNSEDSNL